jgi:hypothetical protein
MKTDGTQTSAAAILKLAQIQPSSRNNAAEERTKLLRTTGFLGQEKCKEQEAKKKSKGEVKLRRKEIMETKTEKRQKKVFRRGERERERER